MLKLLIAFFICSTGYAQDLQPVDFNAGAEFNYTAAEMKREHKRQKDWVKGDEINAMVAETIDTPNDLPSARLLDLTTARIIQRSVAALNHFGYKADAKKIAVEYETNYKFFYEKRFFGDKEIGQHDPMNIWMELVHVAVHIKLGDFWCQYFHTHDLFIINFSTPVVLNPSSAFDKIDYGDHFAGHPTGRWSWDHHGLAGVVSYWAATATCGAATYGLGIITFVCNPISTFVEEVMDRKIAPPIGGKIWDRSQGN
jgi:hypothetical protein